MSRRQWLMLGAVLLAFGLVKLTLVGWYLQRRAAPTVPEQIDCPAMAGRCELPGGVRLLFLDAPSEGHAFTLAIEGDATGEPSAEFSMRSMDMGFNRYRFVRANGRWEARVTLPACVSGRHDWLMTLQLDGRQLRIPLRVR